jgi:hypothetical protein
MDQVSYYDHTMIALHFRDSPPHLITASQNAGTGLRQTSADHPFAASHSHAVPTVPMVNALASVSVDAECCYF